MDPAPAPEDIGKLYFNYYTHCSDERMAVSWHRKALWFIRDCYLASRYGYAGLVSIWFRPIGWLLYLAPFRRSQIDFDIMCLPAHPKGRLLEIGSGSGAFLGRMRRLDWDVCGLDPDPVAVTRSRNYYEVDVRCGTLDQAQFPGEEFDVIVMSHVIEHVHDPVKLLKECYRVLRPGGRLVLTTPNANCWGHKLFGEHWRGLEPPRHLNIFSLHNLERCTKRADFRTVKLRSISRWGRNMFMASEAIRSGSGAKSGWVRLHACVFQMFESIAEAFSVWLGEEIYFIGHKSDSQ